MREIVKMARNADKKNKYLSSRGLANQSMSIGKWIWMVSTKAESIDNGLFIRKNQAFTPSGLV